MKASKIQITVEVSEDVARLLATLGKPKEVIEQLIDHAQQGVYRPGAWEREWLIQAFGTDFTKKLERDPKAPYFDRPRDEWKFQP